MSAPAEPAVNLTKAKNRRPHYPILLGLISTPPISNSVDGHLCRLSDLLMPYRLWL